MYLNERQYLEPPDNEARGILKCFYCDEDIHEGDDYYQIDDINCCEECLNINFKRIAELPDYVDGL